MFVKINHQVHPTNPRFEVYNFESVQQADHFKSQLQSQSIQFEEDQHEGVFYVATPMSHSRIIRKMNHLTLGAFRDKWISDTGVRWLIVLIPLSLLILAIIGWAVS